jgi:glycerol transport system substrate-binding protein
MVRNRRIGRKEMDLKRRDVLKGAATTTAVAVSGAAIISPTPSSAQQLDAAKKWVDSEFQPSTLTKDQQMAEMEWFIKASAPFKGMELSTVSEILSIHDYESKTLTKAFNDITGIKVNHELMNEGLLVDKIEVEIASGKPIYDFWMNDSDFIGTHPRFNDIVSGSLTDFMAGEGKDITSPTLDLKDFIGLDFATFVDGKIYGLPDQQFANLYWFRYDWFQRPELKAAFKKKFGYDLGVPVNWSAYEDIADFFTNEVKEIDGQ